jgi:hypothetical protein
MDTKNIRLIDLNSSESLKREIISFKEYLISLNEHKFMNIMANTDLYNIRDAILADLNKFLYYINLIILMISLKDEIKRFENMVYNKQLA